MNLSSFLARRIARPEQASFSKLIVRIAIISVTLGLTVMIVSGAMIRGFKQEIRDKVFGFWGHIHITDINANRTFDPIPVDLKQDFYPSLEKERVFPIRDNGEPESYFKKKRTQTYGGVRKIQPYVIKPGIIKTQNEIEGILLKGVNERYDWQNFNRYLLEGNQILHQDTAISRDIVLSRQTADRLRLKLGDKLTVYFVRDGNPTQRLFKVGGIYKTGLEEFDKKIALVDMRVLQQLLGWNAGQVSGFEVFTDDLRDLQPIADGIYENKLPNNLYAQTVREKIPAIFEWLDLQDVNEAVILSLMIAVAIINMATALLILILERTNMIGILKALGGSNWSIRRVFLLQAGYILLQGLFWGNLLGIGLCLLQDKFKFIKLREADYYLPYAPISISWESVLWLNIGTMLVTLVFLIVPSYLITRISPLKAIQFK